MRRSGLPVARLNPHHSLLLLPLDCAAVAPPLPSPPGHPRRRAPAWCSQDHPTPARGLFPQRPTHPQRPSLPLLNCGIRKSHLLSSRANPASGGVNHAEGNGGREDFPNRGLVTFLSVAHSSASSPSLPAVRVTDGTVAPTVHASAPPPPLRHRRCSIRGLRFWELVSYLHCQASNVRMITV